MHASVVATRVCPMKASTRPVHGPYLQFMSIYCIPVLPSQQSTCWVFINTSVRYRHRIYDTNGIAIDAHCHRRSPLHPILRQKARNTGLISLVATDTKRKNMCYIVIEGRYRRTYREYCSYRRPLTPISSISRKGRWGSIRQTLSSTRPVYEFYSMPEYQNTLKTISHLRMGL